MTDDFEREPFDPDKHFDPRKVSPSRVDKLLACGIAFEMKYLKQIPEQTCGSAALFGSVVHKALEKWSLNREQALLPLMRSAWIEVVRERDATVVSDFLGRYQSISTEVIKAEHAARVAYNENPRNKGKTCQAPRMTKHFKESDAARKLNALVAEWVPKLNADSPWRFTDRDPLPSLYDESLVLAKRYEARWGHLAVSWHTEFAFEEEWQGFRLNGFIDSIEPLIERETGALVAIGVLDYKTYRKEPAALKDWRQMVMYDLAVRALVSRGALELPVSLDEVPLLVGIDYVRWNDSWEYPDGDEKGKPFPARRFWQMGEADYERLARELDIYAQKVEARLFLPASKSSNPDFCDYGALCCLRSCAQAGGAACQVEVAL